MRPSPKTMLGALCGHCVAQAESGAHGPPPPPAAVAAKVAMEAGTPTASTLQRNQRVVFLSLQHEDIDIAGCALRLSSFATKAVMPFDVKMDM